MSTIRRAPRETNFTIIRNETLRDKRLSWKARGLLSYLLSMPDDWTAVEADLVSRGPDGRSSVRAGLQELEAAGYLVRVKSKGADGRWRTESVVHEDPNQGRKSTLDKSAQLELSPRNQGRLSAAENRPVRSNHLEEETPGDAKRRTQNPWFDALVEAFGLATTPSRRSFYGKTVKELREVGKTPEEVVERARRMPPDWKNAGPGALLKHWDELGPVQAVPDRQTRMRDGKLERFYPGSGWVKEAS